VAQYKLVKMGSDTSGYAVVDAGTLLEIKKGGILAVPYSDKTVLTSKYEGGTVHGPSGLMVAGRQKLFGHFSQTQAQGQTTHLFAAGDKVYPSKIDVSVEKDTVTMGIVACDSCNKTDPPTYNKAQVAFQFPKGSLAKASAGDVDSYSRSAMIRSSRIRAAVNRADSNRMDNNRVDNNKAVDRISKVDKRSNSKLNHKPSRRARPQIKCNRPWANQTRS
jgi:hypothetical protein